MALNMIVLQSSCTEQDGTAEFFVHAKNKALALTCITSNKPNINATRILLTESVVLATLAGL